MDIKGGNIIVERKNIQENFNINSYLSNFDKQQISIKRIIDISQKTMLFLFIMINNKNN